MTAKNRARKYATRMCATCGRDFECRADTKTRFCKQTCKVPEAADYIMAMTRRDARGCLIWTGPVSDRYPTIRRNGTTSKVHRLVWETANGPIAKGLSVCHRCDNTLCVDISHLFLGTHLDNMRDMASKGRGWFQSVEMHDGSLMSLSDLCRFMGVNDGAVRQRVRTLGWTIGRAIAAPKNTKGLHAYSGR